MFSTCPQNADQYATTKINYILLNFIHVPLYMTYTILLQTFSFFFETFNATRENKFMFKLGMGQLISRVN